MIGHSRYRQLRQTLRRDVADGGFNGCELCFETNVAHELDVEEGPAGLHDGTVELGFEILEELLVLNGNAGLLVLQVDLLCEMQRCEPLCEEGVLVSVVG